MDMYDNGLYVNTMQYMRIQEHPIQIDDSLIVIDNLEGGRLRLYEHIDGFLGIQELICGNGENCKNAVMVAEIIINTTWEEAFIHKISCEYGHEHLIAPLIDQVLHFAYFYDNFESVLISDKEFEKCLPYAKETLSGFQKINRVYLYTINCNGAE